MRDCPRTARRPPGPGNRWELIWSHREELLEIARRRSSSAEEAEDAVQEAMLRAVEDQGVPYGRVRSWLRHATVRACTERHRQVARDSQLITSLYVAPAEPFPVEEAACDRAEARWLADRSTELLPARQAEALRLQSEDLDVGQVARVMGLSYRATESLLARAKRSLRTVLAASLSLAMTAWMFVRRFPHTGVAQSAVATSAAATVAAVGLSLPAASLDRPDDRPPRAAADALRPAPALEFSAVRATPEHPHAPSPSPAPQRADGADQDPAGVNARNAPRPYDPLDAAPVEIPVGSVALPELSPPVTPPAIPSLPAGAPGAPSTKAPPVPSGISTDGSTALLNPPRPDGRSVLPG
ncbi:sigma-70 family RNA polymerase sigma factor [Streptomyces sp. NPDC005794]|uniref:RNA polymerase sigma factor n=1 Tax=Streptomyces sp. NPDC005794 TaxID=3364733 RepID=UPI00369A1088